jgi:hypothetical protein
MTRLPIEHTFDEHHKNLAVQIVAKLMSPEYRKSVLNRKSFEFRSVNLFFMDPKRHSLHYKDYVGWYAVFSTMHDAITVNNWNIFFSESLIRDICPKMDSSKTHTKLSYYASRLLDPKCSVDELNRLVIYMQSWLVIEHTSFQDLQTRPASHFVPALKDGAYDIFSSQAAYQSHFKNPSSVLVMPYSPAAAAPAAPAAKHKRAMPTPPVCLEATVFPPPDAGTGSSGHNGSRKSLKRLVSELSAPDAQPDSPTQRQKSTPQLEDSSSSSRNMIILPCLPQQYQCTRPSQQQQQQQDPSNKLPALVFAPTFAHPPPGIPPCPPQQQPQPETPALFPQTPMSASDDEESGSNEGSDICVRYLTATPTPREMAALVGTVTADMQDPSRGLSGAALVTLPQIQYLGGAVHLYTTFMAALAFKSGAFIQNTSSKLSKNDLDGLALAGYDQSFCAELETLSSVDQIFSSQWPIVFPKHLYFIASLNIVSLPPVMLGDGRHC